MKKNNKRDTVNLFFSAFLVTAYVICSFFFSQLASTVSPNLGGFINVLIYAVFGLILFYATRVGEGKQVLRFSPMTLVFLVIPAFYIILAYLVPALPFGSSIAENALIMTVASVAFGYGVPYTFISGYEIAAPEAEEQTEEQPEASETGAGAEETAEDTGDALAEEKADPEDESLFEQENIEYFPEEEQEILAEQDKLDAENNAEEAAFYYYGGEEKPQTEEKDQETGEDESSENGEDKKVD